MANTSVMANEVTRTPIENALVIPLPRWRIRLQKNIPSPDWSNRCRVVIRSIVTDGNDRSKRVGSRTSAGRHRGGSIRPICRNLLRAWPFGLT
jgi:hypothetical protein